MRPAKCACGELTRIELKGDVAVCKACDLRNTYFVLWLAVLVRPSAPKLAELLVKCVDGHWYRVAGVSKPGARPPKRQRRRRQRSDGAGSRSATP